MTAEALAYQKHMNLKIAASELGVPWQTLYVKLKKLGVPVVGDKLRYGCDRDRLGALGEKTFQELVPFAKNANAIQWQAKHDFDVFGFKVDVKAAMPRQLHKRFPAKSWAFSFKKQSLICDYICCFCFGEDRKISKILLVPHEFFAGLQTVSVSCEGHSKWLDYAVGPDDLRRFFLELSE